MRSRPARLGRAVSAAAAVLALALPCHAYFHYIHYNGRNYTNPLYEKFDLTALPNKTVTFFVSDQSPTAYAPNDSFGSVLSQVKQALAAWNGVATSDLRLAFGGLENRTQLSTPNTPGGDVIFVDLPPGVLGLGGPTAGPAPSTTGPTAFFPIVQSVVMLSRDTNMGPGPSYLEEFFTTAVHEIGHALGLQHTWTGSAMSQGVIRTTSRLRPLDADDIAGLSVLYGKPGWAGAFGSISGRVQYTDGSNAALASVVAINPFGSAVSALTRPDGTYQISGVPPNFPYLVYVHPLPPDAVANGEGLRLPVDLSGQQLQATGAFRTVFYAGPGGTLDPQVAQAQGLVPVGTGATSTVNFVVQPVASVPTYDVVTYSSLNSGSRSWVSLNGDIQVTPAFVNSTQNPGLVTSMAAAPAFLPAPQSMTMLGGYATAMLNSPTWPAVWPRPNHPGVADAWFAVQGGGTGPRHLVYNFGNDIYVLPNAMTLVKKGPPQIASVTPNSDGTVTIAGAGLDSTSIVFFDGLQATPAPGTQFTGNDTSGTIVVTPPQGASGQVATITVYNPDGQNSMFLQSQNPPTYPYPTAAVQPQMMTITPNALPANSSAAIDIVTTGANLVDGQVTVGFGSDDVTVRRVWVRGPNHLIANVVVAPNAALGLSEVSIISGFQTMYQPAAFSTVPARVGLPVITQIANADSSQSMIYPGSTVTLSGQNLSTGGGPLVTLNDTPVPLQSTSATQITFVVPPGFPTGMATVKVYNGAVSAFDMRMQIDAPPATITAVTNQAGQSVLGGTAISQGDLITVVATGMDPTVVSNPGRVQVTINGQQMIVPQISAGPDNAIALQVIVAQSFGGAQVPLMVWVDNAASLPVTVTVK